jgi:hypothetical protein
VKAGLCNNNATGGLRILAYIYLAQNYQEPKLNEKETIKGSTSGKRLT